MADPRGEDNEYRVTKSDAVDPESEQAETKTASKGFFGFGGKSEEGKERQPAAATETDAGVGGTNYTADSIDGGQPTGGTDYSAATLESGQPTGGTDYSGASVEGGNPTGGTNYSGADLGLPAKDPTQGA